MSVHRFTFSHPEKQIPFAAGMLVAFLFLAGPVHAADCSTWGNWAVCTLRTDGLGIPGNCINYPVAETALV